MTSTTHNEEIDFLQEMEFRLQQDLNAVHRRLDALIGDTAVRHLAAVPDLPPEA